MKRLDRRRQALSVERAIRRYTNSVLQGSSPCRTDGDSVAQSANYCDAAERAALRADQVRQVVLTAGVPLIQFIPYRNFGLHVDKLTRKHSGRTLRNLVTAAVYYWSSYGLRRKVLVDICRQLFGLEMD